ncbi:hypothetical protein TIFTF001_026891 [Ficus carica]|uniref:Uncharacterized protein n=1 Tax=Ficus carica TaxID=3494 RepID=A0AA88IYT1_FICCA|nr:hypothetical protein TIFTF001_026891 [Ficus carica]
MSHHAYIRYRRSPLLWTNVDSPRIVSLLGGLGGKLGNLPNSLSMGFLVPTCTFTTHQVSWVTWLGLVPSVIGHPVLKGVDQSTNNLCESWSILWSTRAGGLPIPHKAASWFPSGAFSIRLICKI